MVSILQSPGDGNCLFHSLSNGLRLLGYKGVRFSDGDEWSLNYKSLRALCARFANESDDEILLNEKACDWIKMSGYRSSSEYAKQISRNGTWGSGLEMAIISQIFNVNILIYHRGRVITDFDVKSDDTIRLQYNGYHYNLILPE